MIDPQENVKKIRKSSENLNSSFDSLMETHVDHSLAKKKSRSSSLIKSTYELNQTLSTSLSESELNRKSKPNLRVSFDGLVQKKTVHTNTFQQDQYNATEEVTIQKVSKVSKKLLPELPLNQKLIRKSNSDVVSPSIISYNNSTNFNDQHSLLRNDASKQILSHLESRGSLNSIDVPRKSGLSLVESDKMIKSHTAVNTNHSKSEIEDQSTAKLEQFSVHDTSHESMSILHQIRRENVPPKLKISNSNNDSAASHFVMSQMSIVKKSKELTSPVPNHKPITPTKKPALEAAEESAVKTTPSKHRKKSKARSPNNDTKDRSIGCIEDTNTPTPKEKKKATSGHSKDLTKNQKIKKLKSKSTEVISEELFNQNILDLISNISPTKNENGIEIERSVSRGRRSKRNSDLKKKKSVTKEPLQEKHLNESHTYINEELTKFIDHIFIIKVLKTDSLVSELNLAHPVVRVHIVDSKTGSYWLKKDSMRPVTTHYEPNHINYILPVMTNPYNLAENSTKSPHWGQELTYNEDYLHIVQPDVLVLFEVLDFLTTSSKLMQHKDGWHKVAWGFLKLIGTNGQPNTEQDVRLQLYKYPWKLFQPKSDEKTPYVYQCWKQKTLKKYPSTLYVNVYAHTPLSERRIVGRAKTALEIETGKYTLDELMDMYGSKETNLVGGMAKSMLSLHCLKNQWRRKENEPCLIPNKLAYRIHSGSKGSFSCEFSSKGYLLAVASAEIDSHPIKIYEADSGERVATLEGHQDLVYQLKWSEEDSELLSASADCTVRVWGFLDDGTVKHTGLLSHPTFVYTAAFHPELNEPKIIATGAFDGIVRLWTHYRGVTQQNRKPYAKLRSHDSNVNSICFNQDGTQLFSGDGKGIIKIWNAIDFNAGSEVITFELSKTIDSLMGDPIQTLKMHPSNRKMLVQTLGPMAHMLDTRIHRFITHFVSPTSPFIASNSSYPHPFGARKNLPSISEQRHASSFRFIKSTFSPCGSYLFVGSNMCTVDIWRAESGTYVGAFNNTVLKSWKEGNCPVVHISFHPHDHIIAFSIWGEGEPVRVYKWHVEGQEIKMDERNHYQSKESIRMSQHLDVERIVARSLAGGLDKIGETEDNSVLKRKLKLSRNNSNAVPNGVAGECA